MITELQPITVVYNLIGVTVLFVGFIWLTFHTMHHIHKKDHQDNGL